MRLLCGVILSICIPFKSAQAQFAETWVSHAGSESNDCSQLAPCQSLARAVAHTNAGGQVNIMDAGSVGAARIDKSITIANDGAGTAAICCSAPIVSFNPTTVALIWIVAGPNDVVTLRGLTLNNSDGFADEFGVLVYNARQVNIEKCTIRGMTMPGIALAPNAGGGTLTSSISLKIADTVVTGSSTGIKLASVPGVTVSAVLSRAQIDNNVGGGLRADVSGGGSATIDLVGSSVSLNGGNGINAIAGAGQNIVSIKDSVIAKNAAAGVQANGVNAGVLVQTTLLDQNAAGATSVVNGGNMFTYGTNSIVGSAGSGFNHAAGLQ
jgi:hypothetical protein